MSNDFTKEELNDMRLLVLEAGWGTRDLSYKIQSMIDNYCEHEWVNGTYCEKCGRSSAL